MRELISTLKKKKKQAGNEQLHILPKILASEEKPPPDADGQGVRGNPIKGG